jgi:hypothetical protein
MLSQLPQAMSEVGECVAYLRAMAGIKVSDEVIEDTAERKDSHRLGLSELLFHGTSLAF